MQENYLENNISNRLHITVWWS